MQVLSRPFVQDVQRICLNKIGEFETADSHLDDGDCSEIPASRSISLQQFTGQATDTDGFALSFQNFLAGSLLLV